MRLFTSDNNGNTKTAGPLAFTYAQSNRVSQVTDSGNVVGTYTYNGRGERVKTVTPAGTTLFYYGPEGQLLAETDGAGVNKREYVYLDGVPLALLAGTTPTRRSVHTDHLGTPQLLTNQQQGVVWSASYEPFGKANITIHPVVNNLRFPGQYFDAETGLHHNGFRPYDTGSGRYLQPDPLGTTGGLNHYAYVLNNPLFYIDPLGLTAQCPLAPPTADPNWEVERGSTTFHCGYRIFREKREPCPEDPRGECVYDDEGILVTDWHEDWQCQGTPDSYPYYYPQHFWPDPGGPVNNPDAFFRSMERILGIRR